MRVVLSLGGSVLAPELDGERVASHAAAVERLVRDGCDVGVVVGGGGVAREYIETGREMGANEVALDRLGIDVTRVNARLLRAGFGEVADPTLAADYETAEAALGRGETVVMGGVTPGQTTDAVAAVLAESVGADLLVYGTGADGVYDADPAADPDATKSDRLSPSELVDRIAPMSRDAGASAPVDLFAAKLIERAGMRTVVLDGTDPDAVADAVLTGEHTGTDVVPEGGAEPSYWAH
ncbi:UMP kinase [Halobaculum sp. MBLA0143]|uniref:UMP kinase n=1 Tax=Halobaculum sp. MBLA0143 TaxID=3079933 RepID=UPI0035241B63